MVFVRRRRRPRATPAKAVAPVHGPPRPVQPAARPPAPRLISWTALAMLTVGSVGYLGSAPALAVFGLASVFLYVLPAFVFLVPVSLVAAELASGWPGGVYNWVSEGISAPMGLLAVWCEFAQTIFYYPALLAYVASTLAYVFDPGLAGNGVYNAVIIIVLFWGGVLLCSRGAALVARLGSGGTLLGTLIPAAILVALGIAYLVQGHHPAAPVTARQLLPAWNGLASIVLVVNSFFTYAGIEVNAVHVDELRNPAREYPKSIFLAMALVLAVFIGPTLAISWVIPSAQISFTAGVMQAFNSLLTHFGATFAVPLIAIALAVAALAGIIAAMRLRRSQPNHPRGYRAPALGLLCLVGAASSVAALVIGFIPPSQFGHFNPLMYAVLILAGILAIGILPPLLMDRLRKPGWKAAGDG